MNQREFQTLLVVLIGGMVGGVVLGFAVIGVLAVAGVTP